MERIIINADDFGLSKGVNEGIYQLFVQRIVTSTSILANLPGFHHATETAKANPELSVGIHLNLTYGQPLLPRREVKTLVDCAGNFLKTAAPVLENGDALEMEKEFRAQIERCLSAGINLTHMDTHHNLHSDLRVLTILINLAREFKIPAVRRLNHQELERFGVVSPDSCIQEIWFDDDNEKLARLLANLSDGVTEITCHPGYIDQDLKDISLWTWEREKELAFFSDLQVQRVIRESAKQLISFHQFNNTAIP